MSPPDPRIEPIFHEALARAPAEREAFVVKECAGDEALQREVQRLLAAHEEAGAYFERPHSPEIEAELARLKPEEPGERIGPYKLMEQIGEGGFGTVWVADQEQPVRRRVALKIIKLGMDTKEVIARFEQERQALAMMDHPNIAKVLDAGATLHGRPFFVMELVRGIKITEYCDQANLPTAERLALFVQVCQAVQHAHQKGIIHRDLKPSNILVTLHDGVPVPKVIDFGVAKATQQQRLTDLTVYTQFEQMIGTPLYMSPEQAEMSGLDIDTRSDIYSLGVLLYELLIGRTPFDPKVLMKVGLDEIRRVIREQEPPKPSTALQTMAADARASVAQHRQSDGAKMARLLSGELDWIVMKALEKDRARRYETANGFAEDIRRYLANEPVRAAAPSVAYLFRKFARRHKAPLGLAALIAVVLVAATGISLWQMKLAVAAKKETADALGEVKEGKAEVDRKNTEQRAMLAEAARSDRLVAEEKLRAGREHEAFAHLARACEYDPHSTLAAEKAAAALNTWQHPLPATILAGHEERVESAQFSPDGTRIVTASYDKTARVWDAATGKLLTTLVGHEDLVERAQFSPDGTRIVTASSDTEPQRVWDAVTGELLATLVGHEGYVRSAQFSPDGTRIVTASPFDKTARVWDAATGKLLATLVGHEGYVMSAQFSPDGAHIVTASYDKTARVWDAATGTLLATLAGHESDVMSAQYSPDGTRIVTASLNISRYFNMTTSGDKTARVWDAATGKPLATLAGHDYGLLSAQFSPDGTRIVTASVDKTARVWDAATGKSLTTLSGHESTVYSAQFSPDGTRIVTASVDKTARVWDAVTGKSLSALAGHEGHVRSAQFSPDGMRIVTASWDKTARVWDVAIDKPLATLSGHESTVYSAQFSPDGTRIVTASVDKTARVWDAATGKSLTTLAGHEGAVTSAQFSPDGTRIVTASSDKTARVWNAATSKSLAALAGHEDNVTSAQFSPDGTRIVTASEDKTARVWDAATGKLLAALVGHEGRVTSAQFSPDSTRIVTASPFDETKTARVWDAATGKSLTTLAGHEGPVYSVQFSPDGTRIVTTSYDKTARVWDAATGKPLATLAGPDAGVGSAQFTPDGTRIVTAAVDKTARVRVWDATTGKPLATLAGPGSDPRSAQFSPDGTRIVTASDEIARVRVWDAVTGKPVATLADPESVPRSAQLSPDGTLIVTTASFDNNARIWTILPTTAGPPPAWFPDFLRYLAQMRLNPDGELETLKPDEWIGLRAAMRVVRHVSAEQDTPYLRILRRYVPE